MKFLEQETTKRSLQFFLILIIVIVYIRVVILMSIPLFGYLNYLYGVRVPKDVFPKFTSEQEFKNYIQSANQVVENFGIFGFGPSGIGSMAQQVGISTPSIVKAPSPENAGAVRISETNVQIAGIDEPDIVKTDGKQLYYSQNSPYYIFPRPLPMSSNPETVVGGGPAIFPPLRPQPQSGTTQIIKILPPKDMSIAGSLTKGGNLLLSGNMLMVFGTEGINAFDVSHPASPKKSWNIAFDQNDSLLQAKLLNGTLYLVVETEITPDVPCPLKPLSVNNRAFIIPCTEIYHPIVAAPVSVIYTVMAIDPQNGQVSEKTSFVGSGEQSVMYMSDTALYVTYSYNGDYVSFLNGFLSTQGKDLFSASVYERINKLASLDLSPQAKQVELASILNDYYMSLTGDERLRIQNEFQNRLSAYYSERERDMEKTEIIKITLNNLIPYATGTVAGKPLNQFSLDEYNGNLRIATTINGGMFGNQTSANDVYILNSVLDPLGSIQGLGQKEKIYSVRFIQDRGYLVTFRQTDPFFVLDLKNPGNPELKGEMQIPGYSSYLHPISANIILGIGKEGQQLKLSLFDVSDPENPAELDTYVLDEYTSDILTSYHAFLQDREHAVFFIPGQQGGYIFSYAGNKLKLIKAISMPQAERAVYVNNFLYIVHNAGIVALNEDDWTEVNRISL